MGLSISRKKEEKVSIRSQLSEKRSRDWATRGGSCSGQRGAIYTR